MSLLLDALKKAELAKQIAKAESPASEAAGSEPAQPEGFPRSITTREKLPDITQPIEIHTDDLPSPAEARSAGGAPARRELALEDPEPFAPAIRPVPPASESPPIADRAQAEQLFQVKEMDYNPRRPFYVTLGALGAVAVAYGGYVWWQMRPHYSFAEAQAVPGAPAAQVAVSVPAAAPAPVQPAATSVPPQAAGATVAVIPPIQPVRPRPRPQGPAAAKRAENPAPPPAQPASTPIEINAPVLAVDPLVQQGYQAFQNNDLAGARDSYQKALAREPNNRDALLGLAAIDVRNGQLESAEARYLKLLEADPRDSQAVAGLLALRGRLDPAASESRLKTLIASQPASAELQFALGNQYAQQSRWSEAQAAFFKAYAIDSENADYAFNLAVSLDQLHQRKPALDYYQRALGLAAKRAATFDPAQARTRVQELSK
jgi:Tfp pilus assembly protein PilF